MPQGQHREEYWDEWTNDTFSAAGADVLRQKIESYWAARGYTVQTVSVKQPFLPTMRSAHYVIRSDMKDGMPRPPLL